MNRFVISANDGHMPVYPTLSRLTGYYRDGVLGETADIDGLHILMTSSTKLNWLADYIDLGFSVLSPGDLLIHAFLVIVVSTPLSPSQKNSRLTRSAYNAS